MHTRFHRKANMTIEYFLQIMTKYINVIFFCLQKNSYSKSDSPVSWGCSISVER